MVLKTSWVTLSDTDDDPFLQKITIFSFTVCGGVRDSGCGIILRDGIDMTVSMAMAL